MPLPNFQFRFTPLGMNTIFFRVNHPLLQMAFYVPIILALLAWAGAHSASLSWYAFLLYPSLGFLFNTLVDYSVHRFHHIRGVPAKMANLHLDHHRHPEERLITLVPPLGAFLISAEIFLVIYLISQNLTIASLFVVGALVNFIMYEWLHYGIHNYNFTSPWLLRLKDHHMDHHVHPDKNFGTITMFWDKVLGSKVYPSKA